MVALISFSEGGRKFAGLSHIGLGDDRHLSGGQPDAHRHSRALGASQLFPLASSLPWIAKGATLNGPAEALVAIPDPGRHYSVPVGGIISLWWAASFRYGGRHHLVMMGGLDRNQQ
jgi:hypothetical protein